MGFELSDIDPAKRAFSLFGEFQNFAFKGNVIDLAVGVIIGGSFQTIIKSLVDNVIMPMVAAIASGGRQLGKDEKPVAWFEWLQFHIGETPVPIGKFVADSINFVIVAFVLFIVIVKVLGWVLKLRKQEAIAPPPPPPDVQLLTEIRDLLKQQAGPQVSGEGQGSP